MKTNILFICTIVVSFFMFVFCWFQDQLFDSLFTLVMFIFMFILIGFILCFVYSIINIVKNRRDLKNYISIVILSITVILTLFFPFRIMKVELELYLYKKDRNDLLSMVKNNGLEVDDTGHVQLVGKYKKLSTGGEISIYQNNKDGVLIGFWVHRGMLAGATELIYSNGGEKLIYVNKWEHSIKDIIKLDEEWFYVETEY